MEHRDAEITEILVVISEKYGDRLAEAACLLNAAGLEILSTDEEEGIVGGTIESYKLPTLQTLECVNYVRTVLTYIADFATGDPRDLDGDEEDDAA